MTELLGATPSATVGPYLSIGMSWDDGAQLCAAGEDALVVSGTLYDGAGEIVPDGLIEIWQADPNGRFDHPDDPRGARSYPGFRGFGRCATDTSGRFSFRTLKPGALPSGDRVTEAPHIDVSVFARGMLNRLVTRIYFPDEAEANAADPVLSRLGPEVAARLVARLEQTGELSADIRLQGQGETPFFSI